MTLKIINWKTIIKHNNQQAQLKMTSSLLKHVKQEAKLSLG